MFFLGFAAVFIIIPSVLVDDVGALTVANVLHNRGEANLLGVAVNTPSQWGAEAASVVNTYFGNGDIPIAAMKPTSNVMYFDDATFMRGEFASKVANNFARALNNSASSIDPVNLYRTILDSADNNSITIISIGFFDNLSALLNSSTDMYSRLSGEKLITEKVKELVIMGGEYPSGWEYNFGGGTPLATYHVVNNWPASVPITFSGFSLGDKIQAGSGLSYAAPSDFPVLAAYRWYAGGCNTRLRSWDPVTTLYAVLGLNQLFKYAVDYGYNYVFPNGSNTWIYDENVRNRRWIDLADEVSNVTVAKVLDEIYQAATHG